MRVTHSTLAFFLCASLALPVAAAPQATAPTAKPAPSTAPSTPAKSQAGSPTAPVKKKTTAILPLAAVGIDDGTRLLIQNELRSAMGARGAKLQEATATQAHITASRLSCVESDTGCLVKLGFIATVEEIVAGRIEPAPGGHKIVLHLVDVEGARQVKRVEDLLAADAAGRTADIARVTGELLGADPVGGDIRITCDKPNAVVLIDGVKVGLTPLAAPVKGLVRGRHTIEVRLAGHKSFQGFADVENGKTADVKVEMISMLEEDVVVVQTGPLETTEVREGGPAAKPDDVNLIPMVLLVAGTGSLIVGVIGFVLGVGGLGYAAVLDQAIKQAPVQSNALAVQQTGAFYVGVGGLVATGVGVLLGGALLASSFFVE